MKKKVIIGLTGGVDSLATAILLKKQGLDCYALSLVLQDKEEIKKAIEVKIESKKEEFIGLDAQSLDRKVQELILEHTAFLNSHCGIEELEKIKDLCDNLEIPHFAHNAVSQYEALVIDPFVAGRLIGETINACVFCHNVKMSIIYDKCNQLNMDYFSSGHYAKVLKNESKGNFQIYAGIDQEYDQSYLLSSLSQDCLSKLILPLGGLRKNDVNKIIEHYKINPLESKCTQKQCFKDCGKVGYFVETRSPESLYRDGGVFLLKDETQVGENLGIHHYRLGDNNIDTKDRQFGVTSQEKAMVVAKIEANGKIHMGNEDSVRAKNIVVKNLTISLDTNLSKPLNVFVKNDISSERKKALLITKNNLTGQVFLEDYLICLERGQHLVFYDRPTGGKVLGYAQVGDTITKELKSRLQDTSTYNEVEEYVKKAAEGAPGF